MPPDQPKPTAAQAFADAIRTAREQSGLTIDAVAARAGLETPAYQELERGERQPDFDTIMQIAEALELSATELMRRAGL